MAACSSSHSSAPVPAHDIFLSHSGAQKPFVEDLYQLLREKGYTTFFDIKHHSLPLGEHFPFHIFRAAQTCRLAVVVLSEEYARSKWPMLELCAFVAATPRPKILPLFLKLTVNDLKQKENLDRWCSAWQKFAEEDPSRIDVSQWTSAFRKVSSYNGITLNQYEEESAYIERVLSGICQNVPPSIRYDFSRTQGIHRLSEIVLAEFGTLGNDRSKVCVLGMYGLPGSGKSTICRYLYECLFSQFAGKAMYWELPTDANDKELLIKSKELLKQLTNFNNKLDLSNVLNFEQVYHLLQGTDIVSSRVFLVVDNISSQKSRNVVKELLRLGLTEGSKVLLVARSINILRPLLQQDGSHQSSHYVYGSMSVPCLNKKEALRVLLQPGYGVSLGDSYAPEAAFTPREKEIMEEVVNISGFSEELNCIIYLPLVLKIVGEKLREHELNVEEWNRTMKNFQRKVGLCKEEALKEMVLGSFRTLSGRLRDLFLDVALFIVPLSYSDGESHRLDEACSHLSLIHGCKPEEIEFEMQKLQQHGFLTIWKGRGLLPTVSVHDFYLEFAASIEEASKYYWSCGFRWNKVQRNQAIEAVGPVQLELRTVVLELDEVYEHFEFSSDFPSLRAMVLRNCRSLKTLQGLASLRSLVSLEICDCPSLKWVELPATGHKQPYIQRFKWVNRNVEFLQQQDLETSSSMKAIWRLFWENIPQIGFKRPPMTVDSLLLQMKGLQDLRLENTCIRRYVDMSGCLPQLRMLEVRERHLKGLRVCNLPNLERFVFFGDAKPPASNDIDCHIHPCDYFCDEQVCDSLVPRRRVTLGKEFLAGCPKVQEVFMQCIAFEDEANQIILPSSHLTHLRVNGLWNVSRSPDLSASLESLKELLLSQCQELRSLNFGCIFRNLQGLCLEDCHNLTEVSGLGGLVMLESLEIRNCPSLQVVSHLGGLVSLQHIEIRECRSIQRCLLPDLDSLIELRSIVFYDPGNVKWTLDVRKLVKLTGLSVDYSCGKLIGLESLERLGLLVLDNRTPDIEYTTLVDLATLLGIMAPCCSSLKALFLYKLGNLRSLNGIQFLGSIKDLELYNIQNLSCLQGMECLGELQSLRVSGCASMEEMPSLSTLVKLQILSFSYCEKLRKVEGCDELDQLRAVWVQGCQSLACLPLGLRNWNSSVDSVAIAGCKFATGEVVAAWAEDEEVPGPLRHASLIALRWELSSTNAKTTSEMLLDRVVQKAHNRCFKDDDDYNSNGNNVKYEGEEEDDGNYEEEVFVARVRRLAIDFDYGDLQNISFFYNHINREVYDRVSASHKALEEGLCCFAKLPKQCLVDLCRSDAHFPSFLYYLFHHLCDLLVCPDDYSYHPDDYLE